MWGEDLFYAMYDEPELVAAVMQLITDTYMRFMERWQALGSAAGRYLLPLG